MAREAIPEQIPWTQYVKVTDQSDLSISLELGGDQTASIWHKDFEWSISLNTKIMIDNHMTLDERLTKDIQEYWEAQESGGTFKEKILGWLKGGVVIERVPKRKGPKEWRPRPSLEPKIKARIKNTDGYGYGNTTNEDNAYYWGDVFEFAHFETVDGDEGAVIIWHGGGDPRGNYGMPMVYMGDFGEFMDSQYEHDPWSYETFLSWNSNFENGFMWSFEKLGVFDDWDEHIQDYDDRHVKQVLKAIEKDPSILLPESVEKIIDDFGAFPEQIQKATRWLMANRRRELERAIGQELLWKDLYPDE